jgi:hypothetical protein
MLAFRADKPIILRSATIKALGAAPEGNDSIAQSGVETETTDDGSPAAPGAQPTAPTPDNGKELAPKTWTQERFPNAELGPGGKWEKDGDELVQSSTAVENSAIAFGDPTWSRYDLTLKAMAIEGRTGFGIAWHVSEGGRDYRIVRFGWIKNSQHQLSRNLDDKNDDSEMRTLPGAIERGVWHDVRIEVRGAACRCFLDGRHLADFDKADPRFRSGRIGLGGYATAMRFKDIKVTDENGKVLWERLPELPGDAKAGTSTTDRNGFVSLFNGKDLSGWKTHPSQPNHWKVEQGILIGQGREPSWLFSQQDDFDDVHVRAEVRINENGNGGIVVRSPLAWAARGKVGSYQVEINPRGGRTGSGTGAIYRSREGVLSPVTETIASGGQWFTIEVIVKGVEVAVIIEGKQTALYRKARPDVTNHIALEMSDGETKVEFRKIEAKRL